MSKSRLSSTRELGSVTLVVAATQFAVLLVLGGSLGLPIANSQEPSANQVASPTSLGEVREQIKFAGRLFKEEQFDASAQQIEACNRVIEELILNGERKDLPEWERAHRQLVNAAEALCLQGAELTAIADWKEIQDKLRISTGGKGKTDKKPASPSKNSSEDVAVSFSKEIVPILIEHCGRCHVDKASGEFTMASYEQLAKGSKAGVVIFPGDPASSPLISMVDSRQMPPNGNRVPEEKLAKLKAWVAQGAKYDGSDPKAAIKSLANDSKIPVDNPVAVKERTGKETVSFSSDIAPILVANCNGCHYMGNNAPGGLRMNNFNELLKGGDSGPALAPSNAEDSLLLKKLLGTAGQRMPAGGRPPLSEQQIALVKTWIDEGAAFDGDSRDSRLDAVIAKDFAANATHKELMARRMERARANWQIIAPKSQPDEAFDSEFHIIGNVGKSSAEKLLAQANQAAKGLRRQWKLNPKESLVKGGITIYALKSRYDYSELGKMHEKRTLPAEWSAHWRKETPDLYIAMVNDPSDPKLNESALLQQLTSIWVASHDGAPKWFCEGAGRSALASSVGLNDARVQPWVKRFPLVVGEIKTVQVILDGKMNDEDEAVLGFGLIRQLQTSPLKPKYELTLRQLAAGSKFDEVFVRNLGPVDAFLKQALDKK